mmetsp:Transcript_104660/g.197189  ORF Transcript_104660/g.197189 Transcript_104660/m.197189 type:complete len:211 (-) Transcript_104660:2395-3027(-)
MTAPVLTSPCASWTKLAVLLRPKVVQGSFALTESLGQSLRSMKFTVFVLCRLLTQFWRGKMVACSLSVPQALARHIPCLVPRAAGGRKARMASCLARQASSSVALHGWRQTHSQPSELVGSQHMKSEPPSLKFIVKELLTYLEAQCQRLETLQLHALCVRIPMDVSTLKVPKKCESSPWHSCSMSLLKVLRRVPRLQPVFTHTHQGLMRS